MNTILRFFLFIILLTGCHPQKSELINPEEIDFSTDDASELFFKNVRELYYEKEVMEEAKLDIYRLKSRSVSEVQPVLNLAIVMNWRFDEAYLLIEPNSFLSDLDRFEIIWKDPGGESNEIAYEMGNKSSQLEFATLLYNGILRERTFQIKVNQNTSDLLKDAAHRESFRITFFDYLRLVGAR